MNNEAFNTDLYLSHQYKSIKDQMLTFPKQPTYIEFGGKPGDDHHAARVLPGYRPDAKIELLQTLLPSYDIAMVLNTKDILKPPHGRYLQSRVRGDSGLFYLDETLRLVDWLETKNLKPKSIVLSVIPRQLEEHDTKLISYLQNQTNARGIEMFKLYEIDKYPNVSILDDPEHSFENNDVITKNNENLIIFSPGGGSGKFGVALSEIYKALKRGIHPNFIKFETFPVFKLGQRHPLNIAFEAATADLNNQVKSVIDKHGNSVTTYDKDIENFNLLKGMYEKFGCDLNHPILKMIEPTEMGVNMIDSGIVDMEVVIKACKFEILRRLRRYKNEYRKGLEQDATVKRTAKLWEEIKLI